MSIEFCKIHLKIEPEAELTNSSNCCIALVPWLHRASVSLTGMAPSSSHLRALDQSSGHPSGLQNIDMIDLLQSNLQVLRQQHCAEVSFACYCLIMPNVGLEEPIVCMALYQIFSHVH